jgi:hypothetical protein
MTEPSRPRPVPGPPRPGPRPAGGPAPVPGPLATGEAEGAEAPADEAARFADLDQRPVAEHVAVYEDEYARLQRELGTIDQL